MADQLHTPVNAVNANIGIMNIIERDEIRNTMMKTFIELADKLKVHCGPYSGTAILTNPDDPLAEPVFTKDGINIVRAMQYAAPMQDFVRKQLAYMGARVERSAGDGTTSTMIIMAYTLASLLEYFSTTKFVYSTNDIATTWKSLVVTITKAYEQFVDRAAKLTDKDTIRFVAASQAYTSSHGDKELAHCIGELFSNTPREVWDTLSVTKAVYECEERYKVTVDPSEYTLDNCRLFPNDKCNAELGTVLDLKDANVIIMSGISIGDDLQSDFIKYIDEQITSEEHPQLIIVTNDVFDHTTREHFDELFSTHPKHNVIFVMVPEDDQMLNDVNAASAIRYESDKVTPPSEDNKYHVFKADVRYESAKFRFLKGLLPVGIENTGINPFYNDPDHPEFNEFVSTLKQIIVREKADVARVNTKMLQRFVRILHKLVATKDVVFTVGGAAYDNAATQDVAIDALLATKCSLTKGFVAGRCVTLKSVLHDIDNDMDSTCDKTTPIKIQSLTKAFIKAILSGIEEVDKALEDSVGVSQDVTRAIEYKDAPIDYTRLDDPSYAIPLSVQDALDKKSDYCILEPVETDITFIKRFGEIGLKFLTAHRVITLGYMFNKQ